MTEAVTVSTRISDLNLDQLLQVFHMVQRQQEALVAQNQALGQEIDAIREQRAQIVAQVSKYSADMEALTVHIKAREAERDAAKRVAEAGDSPTLAEVLRLDGEAPGVILEASASGG